MKEKGRKTISKQIICIITVIMLCNFIVPNYIYAADTSDGGKIFNPIMKFITFLCDSLMQILQNTFTSNQSISNGNGTYNYQYSPAIIFSGKVQGLDINFIEPNENEGHGIANWLQENRKVFAKQADVYEWEEYEQLPEGGLSGCSRLEEKTEGVADYYTYYKVEDNQLYVYFFAELYADSTEPVVFCYYENCYELTNEFLEETNTIKYTSIAYELQPTIATWYNALRRIALVGLLSVLVYLGIRILLSSASAEGNSKYKKMLTDWLVALCLLFTLHYIMSAILLITQKLSDIFNIETTDRILNTLRENIERCNNWGEALAQVIMYVVMVIYTISFTWQYLKRVLYMAFFTMIAPLITLTYPLDKVKDSKAQAFTMWIREYVFNALIQIVHLVVYYVLIGSAVELATSFPLYAIVAIGFMQIGEKIIRSMFGFNNAETVGTMQAAAMGGLIATGLNKLKKMPKGKKTEGGAGSGSGDKTNNKVRTATNNPMGANPNTVNKKDSGAKALVRKYGKTVAGEVVGAGTGIAGGIIGAAAGLAQGDIGAALTGAGIGITAGNNIGKNATEFVAGIPDEGRKIRDTYRAGVYGEEVANAIRFDEEFRKGSTYQALQSNSNFSEENLQAMLNAGITDKKAMTKILDSGMDVNEAIKYHTLAQNCPPEIFYNQKLMKTFCSEMRKRDSIFEGQSYGKIRDTMKKFI